MKRSTGRKKIDKESKKMLDESRKLHTDALNRMKDVQMAVGFLLFQEARRYEKKLGKGEPRVLQLEGGLRQNIKIVNDLETELEIAKIEIPKVRQNDLLIHGRITNRSNHGIKDLTVFMSDAKGKVLTTKEKTDGSGYYSIVADSNTIKKIDKSKKKGIFLTVSNDQGKVIYRKPESRKLGKGDRVTTETILVSRVFDRREREGRILNERKTKEKMVKKRGKKTLKVDIEEISGIGPARAKKLKKAGIKDTKAFSKASEAKLKRILGDLNIRKMKRESASLIEKKKRAVRKRGKKKRK